MNTDITLPIYEDHYFSIHYFEPKEGQYKRVGLRIRSESNAETQNALKRFIAKTPAMKIHIVREITEQEYFTKRRKK